MVHIDVSKYNTLHKNACLIIELKLKSGQVKIGWPWSSLPQINLLNLLLFGMYTYKDV